LGSTTPVWELFNHHKTEIDKNEVKGPLMLKELESDTNQLGINIVFTPIEKLEKEP
jgi:hypothetical protein